MSSREERITAFFEYGWMILVVYLVVVTAIDLAYVPPSWQSPVFAVAVALWFIATVLLWLL